jgi:hypothetical protein
LLIFKTKIMLRNKIVLTALMASAVLWILAGCYKDKTVISDTGNEITRTVSFANDILPIFNNSCSVSGCHTPGAKSPDLSASNAFNSLVTGNYLNTTNPETSSLYLWMTGKKGTPMPVSGINKDYNALVKAWIKQGANNN